MTETELLTVSQAAAALNASTQSIRNWIRSDRLHAVRIGNRFAIPRSEVERMLGDVLSARGESPWEFADDAPAASLPRAADRSSAPDPADGLLGA
jgi:excisionase family DNA binding protein